MILVLAELVRCRFRVNLFDSSNFKQVIEEIGGQLVYCEILQIVMSGNDSR